MAHARWADQKVPDPAWRAPKGLTHAERAIEQDVAAGGRDRRLLRRADGSEVVASLYLRVLRMGRRCYAYLRYSAGNGQSGKTVEVYVGQVRGTTRDSNLKEGWALAHSRGLLDQRRPGPDGSNSAPTADERRAPPGK